jgi:hypothetical protein
MKDNVRDRVFPIRISINEEIKLRKRAKKKKKTIAELIRSGYLSS